jgi:hypothetical protein
MDLTRRTPAPTQRDVDAARRLEQQRSRDVQKEQQDFDKEPGNKTVRRDSWVIPWDRASGRAHP